MVAYQTEAAIIAISADVKQMSTTGAQISEHLQKLDARLQSLEAKAADAVNLSELEHVLDEAAMLRDENSTAGGTLSPDAEREIKHLLSHVRHSKHRFAYANEDKGGMRFYLQLFTKYKTYEKVLASAEDFIDKVGTKTIAGHSYQVVVGDEESVALDKWLAEELKAYRAAGNGSKSEEK